MPNSSIFTGYSLADLAKRVEALEQAVYKNNRKDETSKTQQLLLLKHLGLLEKLNELDISQTKIAEILAVLLNKSAGNLKKDLSQINDDMSELSTRDNYQFLVNFFGKIKLQKQLEETSIILKKVIDEKEKQLVKNNRK